MTNIVVVQFVSDIQTSMDVKYNLTCTTRGPGSAVVTSGLIGSGYCHNSSRNIHRHSFGENHGFISLIHTVRDSLKY